MLLVSIKRFLTLLLLLSLFGQAVAGGVMSCQMDMDKNIDTHAKCGETMDHGSDTMPEQPDHSAGCDQACDCCLGACSASASMPTNSISLNQGSLIRTGYKDLALINRTESLYRPPIAC